jgi:hypothetical protein
MPNQDGTGPAGRRGVGRGLGPCGKKRRAIRFTDVETEPKETVKKYAPKTEKED